MTEAELFKLSFGLSEMARTHRNDVICNALAELADRLPRRYANGKVFLTDLDKKLLLYYHQHKG